MYISVLVHLKSKTERGEIGVCIPRGRKARTRTTTLTLPPPAETTPLPPLGVCGLGGMTDSLERNEGIEAEEDLRSDDDGRRGKPRGSRAIARS